MPRSCDPFRQNHKRYIIEKLHDEYADLSEENFFLSIGKITPWSSTDDTRVSSIDSVKDNTDFWRGMIAAKPITRSDVSLVIRRIDWTPGKVYQPYRDTIDLYDDIAPADFYTLVDDERVYVCIDNDFGKPSLYPPTHTDAIVKKLADGYRWKFLYSIPESKRKFLTRSNGPNVGFMPIDFVKILRTDDERELQWLVQQAAVNGKIEFAYIDQPANIFWVTTQSCILPSQDNILVTSRAVGATNVNIYSPELAPNDELYTDMMFTIETGPGQGQRRPIKAYTYTGNTAILEIEPLTIGLSGQDEPLSEKRSRWSITPKIVVAGDGFGNSTANPTIRTADFTLKFGATANSQNDCLNFQPRYVSSVEVVDGGKDYTFANLSVPKGITSLSTTPPEYKDFRSLIHAVMPPPGGHGANAVRELGTYAYMIVKDFVQDEQEKLDVGNDFRQFGIIRNPLLSEPQVRIKFYQTGLSGSFQEGATAGNITGPYGTVLKWCKGVVGFTGPNYNIGITATSELFLTEIRGGTFAPGMSFGGLQVFDVLPVRYAGRECRRLLDLTLESVNPFFLDTGQDYHARHFAFGMGNKNLNIPQSRSSGYIECWTPNEATYRTGTMSLEFPKGEFYVGEFVTETDPQMVIPADGLLFGNSGYTGVGRILSMDTHIEELPDIYDLTATLTVTGVDFDSTTFLVDSQVYFSKGITDVGNGYIIDWVAATGGTSGTLRLTGTQGKIVTGQKVDYVILEEGGATVGVNADVSGVSHLSELKYASGEVLYIQNVDPIVRDLEQREEIKLVIEL